MSKNIRDLLPSKIYYIPVITYRLLLIIILMVLFVGFSATSEGYCSFSAATSVSKLEAFGCLEYWINRYQTLAGGILAFIGAALAFTAVRTQISQTDRLAEAARRRKEQATTAVAPFALSLTVDYAWKCMDAIIEARDEVLRHIVHPNFLIPDFPSEVILLLRDYVEFGDEDYAKSASMLLYAAQIQQSRIQSLKKKVAAAGPGLYGDGELQDAMFDALDLHAQVSALFSPVRKDYKNRKFSTNDMYNDLRIRGLELDEWPRLKFKIEAFVRSQEERNT